MGGRLMTAAVMPDISAREEAGGGVAEVEAAEVEAAEVEAAEVEVEEVEPGRALRTEAPTGLETSQAESGRSLR
jgi:hypothetical protein